MRAYASEMLVGSIHVREFDTAILCSQIWSSAVSVHIKAIIGAEEGTRTPTPLRVHGPEPCASANSATSALCCARPNPALRREILFYFKGFAECVKPRAASAPWLLLARRVACLTSAPSQSGSRCRQGLPLETRAPRNGR